MPTHTFTNEKPKVLFAGKKRVIERRKRRAQGLPKEVSPIHTAKMARTVFDYLDQKKHRAAIHARHAANRARREERDAKRREIAKKEGVNFRRVVLLGPAEVMDRGLEYTIKPKASKKR